MKILLFCMVSEQAAWDSDHFRFFFREAQNVSSVWESSLGKSLGKIEICLFSIQGLVCTWIILAKTLMGVSIQMALVDKGNFNSTDFHFLCYKRQFSKHVREFIMIFSSFFLYFYFFREYLLSLSVRLKKNRAHF